jgi:hypothetical protein
MKLGFKVKMNGIESLASNYLVSVVGRGVFRGSHNPIPNLKVTMVKVQNLVVSWLHNIFSFFTIVT